MQAPVKRSRNWIVQTQCALALLGPQVHAILQKDQKTRSELRAMIPEHFKQWKLGAEPKTAVLGSERSDIFPNLLQLPAAEWITDEREVILKIQSQERSNAWFSCFCCQDPEPVCEGVVLQSTDPVHVAKGLCMIASAFKYNIVLGSKARLSRYLMTCPNKTVSDWNGDIWSHTLLKAFWPTDTPLLEIKNDNSDTKAQLVEQLVEYKVDPKNNDIIVWLPFVLLALSDGAESTVESIVQHLARRWNNRWSVPMIDACLLKLQEYNFKMPVC